MHTVDVATNNTPRVDDDCIIVMLCNALWEESFQTWYTRLYV